MPPGLAYLSYAEVFDVTSSNASCRLLDHLLTHAHFEHALRLIEDRVLFEPINLDFLIVAATGSTRDFKSLSNMLLRIQSPLVVAQVALELVVLWEADAAIEVLLLAEERLRGNGTD